jgi:hypothetical protein
MSQAAVRLSTVVNYDNIKDCPFDASECVRRKPEVVARHDGFTSGYASGTIETT